MSDLISVIVPVYNVAQYVTRCVESICNQTYSALEIILVNDGSTDQSGLICEKLARSDRRIRVLHKENGGLSDARNAGLEVATGEWIGFVDSDDFIKLDYFERLYQLATSHQADIVEVNMILTDGAGYEKQKAGAGQSIFDQSQALQAYFSGNTIENNVGFKLFKASIVTPIRFKVGYTSEDVFFTFESLLAAQKVVTDKSYAGYYYVMRPNSIMNAQFTKNDIDAVILAEQIVAKTPTSLQEAAKAKLIREKVKCVERMIRKRAGQEYDEIKQRYLADIRQYTYADSRRYLSRKQQLTLMLMKLSPKLYSKIYQKYQKQ